MPPSHTIALDATVISERLKGAGRVMKNLLAALPAADPVGAYIAFVTPAGARIVQGQAPDVKLCVVRLVTGVRWELLSIGREAHRQGADLLFTVREIVGFGGPPTVMHVFEPPAYRLRSVGVEDARPFKHIAKDYFLQANLRGSVRRAAGVTAGADATAAWLRRRYGVDPPVIYPGIDTAFLGDDSSTDRNDHEPYFLHPATGDPRENTELVLQAFARARPPGIRLCTVGTPERLRHVIVDRATELGVADVVDVEGWVSDGRLRELYGCALALVHPSKYESFAGLPALEAMARGTPVIALGAPGASEALEGVALLIAREDPELLADGLRLLAEDAALRESLGRKGAERARGLTWDVAAKAFVSVFHRVLGG